MFGLWLSAVDIGGLGGRRCARGGYKRAVNKIYAIWTVFSRLELIFNQIMVVLLVNVFKFDDCLQSAAQLWFHGLATVAFIMLRYSKARSFSFLEAPSL